MYLTFYKNKKQQKISIADLYNGTVVLQSEPILVTVQTDKPPEISPTKLGAFQDIRKISEKYNNVDLSSLYYSFKIPKRTGGLRDIDAPSPELKQDLTSIKNSLINDVKILTHNSAYAYVRNRTILDALKKHQKYNARWFLKIDIKSFFPSCTQEFVINTLKNIYPFNVLSIEQLHDTFKVCFKEGVLPQGAPTSPLLSNIIMVPIDFAIEKLCERYRLTYTRYADDILISAPVKWDWQKTITELEEILQDTPFKIKQEKTRFGSNAGRNWNLGLMYNKDKNITIGYRKKKLYKTILNNLFTTESIGQALDTEELQYIQGLTSYYRSIEPNYISKIIGQYEQKYSMTLSSLFKKYL